MQLFTGSEYLMIDIANNYGLDKSNWDERIQWFKDNYGNLPKMINEAENPALFFAGIKAWDAYQRGAKSGYPISLDATSSGLQLLACLTQDVKAAKLCNVLDTGSRRDAYTDVFDVMVDELMKRFGDSAGKISRDDCKRAIMTSLYGSQAVPKEVFGEGTQLRIFYDVMASVAPLAWGLNNMFLQIWDPTATMNSWVLPDNFHVHVKVMSSVKETVQFFNTPYETFHKVNEPMENGRSLGANCIHSVDGMVVREMVRRCTYDPAVIANVRNALTCIDPWDKSDAPEREMCQLLWDHYEKSGFLSARILDYVTHKSVDIVDRDVVLELINSLPAKRFEVLTVHDCFRCLPKYGNDLRIQYNRILAEITRSKMLQFLLRQIMKKDSVVVNQLNPTMWLDVLKANYALS